MRASRIASVAVVAMLAVGCATPAPPEIRYITRYDCSETLETADGRFRVEEFRAWWGRDLGEGVGIQMGLSLEGARQAGFATDGFAVGDHGLPIFFIEYDQAFGRRNYRVRGVPHLEVASEMRLGDRFERKWMPVNTVHGFRWADAVAWLEAEPAGDFVFILYDTAGTRLQGATLPRDALSAAERTLKALHARVMSKAASRETACKVTVEPDFGPIIV